MATQNATEDSSPEDNTECRPVRAPAQVRQREEQASPPPPKKKEGGRGKGTKTAHSRPTTRQHHHRRPGPPPREKKKKKKRGDPRRGTGGPPTQNRQHQASNSGLGFTRIGEEERRDGEAIALHKGKKRDTQKKKKKKREPPAQPEGKGMEGQGPQSPGKKKKRKEKTKAQKKKNTPRQPSQDGLGTGETRAQHTRPHRAPEPETAGGKRGAHETTHVPQAGRNRSPTTNTTNSRH